MSKTTIFTILLGAITTISLMIAIGLDDNMARGEIVTMTNNYWSANYSIDIPHSWAYELLLPPNVKATPDEFGELLVNDTRREEIINRPGAYVEFLKVPYYDYPIQDAPFDVYVKHKIYTDRHLNSVVMSIQNATIDGEPAVKIHDKFSGAEITMYLIWHNEEPYDFTYVANVKDYQKYLPEFEQMVKTFKFVRPE